MSQGWLPDIISTDVARMPDRTPTSLLVPMASFLHLGMSLDQIVERVTTIPGKILNYPEKVGTLEPGVPADVSILELIDEDFEAADMSRPAHTRTLKKQFMPIATMKSGIFVKAPATT